jgi:cytochrome c peroxidase
MKKNIILYSLLFLIISFWVYSCKSPSNELYKKVNKEKEQPNGPYLLDVGFLPEPKINPDNPLTHEGVALGRRLFYEKMLSKNNQIACASCHKQQYAFSDTTTYSIGVRKLPGTRNAMAAINMAWNSNGFFWDGRAKSLREQFIHPIQDSLEMDEKIENVVAKLKSSTNYSIWFQKAFKSKEITPLLVYKALEQFLNAIVSNNSKYDKFLQGTAILTPEEERGRFLFMTEYNPTFPDKSGAECFHCHGGANFENDEYMNNGIDIGERIYDIGREKITNNPYDKGKFKVPTLRNVELTKPYMHDGRFENLEQVIESYNYPRKSNTLSALLSHHGDGLQLSDYDKKALVSFLKTLTDKDLISNKAYSNPFENN